MRGKLLIKSLGALASDPSPQEAGLRLSLIGHLEINKRLKSSRQLLASRPPEQPAGLRVQERAFTAGFARPVTQDRW